MAVYFRRIHATEDREVCCVAHGVSPSPLLLGLLRHPRQLRSAKSHRSNQDGYAGHISLSQRQFFFWLGHRSRRRRIRARCHRFSVAQTEHLGKQRYVACTRLEALTPDFGSKPSFH